MESHVKALGVLHIVFGALGVFGAVVILFVFGGLAGLAGAASHLQDPHLAAGILGVIGTALCIFILALSLPGLIAGVGLLQFRPWARILTIVLSVLDLMHTPPIGTALGVYGLWVLLSKDTERLFRRS